MDKLGQKPPVVIEEVGFWKQIRPHFYCGSPIGQFIEDKLLQATVPVKLIGDDRIVKKYFSLEAPITTDTYGIDMKREKAGGSENVGYRDVCAIEDLEEGRKNRDFSRRMGPRTAAAASAMASQTSFPRKKRKIRRWKKVLRMLN